MEQRIPVVLFWIARLATSSASLAAVQSLYKRYEGYAPLNAVPRRDLSGSYGMLTDCGLACSRHPDCSAFSHSDASDTDVHCDMMGFDASAVAYLELKPLHNYVHDVLAVSYIALALNLTAMDGECIASSTANETSTCFNLWDGETVTKVGTEWVSQYEHAGGWVWISWNSEADIITTEIWRRCRRADQCSSLEVTYSSGTTIKVGLASWSTHSLKAFHHTHKAWISTQCLNDAIWPDCSVRAREFYQLKRPTRASWVNITCLAGCENAGAEGSWGLQEVNIWHLI